VHHSNNCEVFRGLWVSIFYPFELDWVMPKMLKELLASWRCQFRSMEDGLSILIVDVFEENVMLRNTKTMREQCYCVRVKSC